MRFHSQTFLILPRLWCTDPHTGGENDKSCCGLVAAVVCSFSKGKGDVFLAAVQDLTQQLQDCQAETREMASEAIGAVRTVRSFHADRKSVV